MDILYDKSEIIKILKSKDVIDFLNKYNITTMIMFGSITNNEFNDESDVDLALVADIEIELDKILDIELFLQNLLNREIDILDLRSEVLDLFLKINILNTGKVIYSKDNSQSLNILYDEVDKIYRENENFIYFRKVDVLS
ncbi:nucleotidyltransferase domain-containing protein [Clostridium sp. CS001]|uniref:type VII toxin-antitoxin system MntA family adenylyltransferase antitoxin n=1 Tax=Clostridium sp. CS001 TaxID=2880648 RepID=UPI001CF28D3E|nr:nucleotidyltransferase domain-containing protein [Clostridium sp. CS001]MCB2290923.1 nucleotidyltransferase domain-containing protein [Clostridium sp. CS001]